MAWAERPALNAVVITQWRNALPGAADAPWVILTNGNVNSPWPPVEAYDDRSWIENELFRNSKQFWTLLRWFPQKDAAGVRAHLTLVLLLLATATAYRLWDKAHSQSEPMPPTHLVCQVPPHCIPDSAKAAPEFPPLAHGVLQGLGMLRWRRALQQENRDKLIVFVGAHYGIFDAHELLILTYVPLQQLPPHLGSPADVLRRYSCLWQEHRARRGRSI